MQFLYLEDLYNNPSHLTELSPLRMFGDYRAPGSGGVSGALPARGKGEAWIRAVEEEADTQHINCKLLICSWILLVDEI